MNDSSLTTSFRQAVLAIVKTAGTRRAFVVFIAIWVAIVLLGGIPHGDLSGYDDAAYAHEARAMIQSGDIWTPNLNGITDFDKPPLFIWMLAISFKLFGISDTAAKIPGVLFGWATVLLVYFLAKELFSGDSEDSADTEWLPALSMLCMATTQYFLKYSSHAMTDVPFTFFFTAAIYFYVLAQKNRRYLLLSGLATGLALMLRSPMGLFPLVIIFLDIGFKREFRSRFAGYFTGSLAIALAIPAVWYLREYGVYGHDFIDRHFANVVAHSAAAVDRTAWQKLLSYFEYIILLVKLYLPWFPLMAYGIVMVVKKARFKAIPAEVLLLGWILVVVIPFSAADSKALRYILSAFPAFAVLSALGLTGLIRPELMPKFARAITLVLALAAAIIVAVPNFQARAEDMRMIAPVSDSATPPGEHVLIYTSGEYGWNYYNQLIWYGNRLAIHAREPKDIDDALTAANGLTIVTDRIASAKLESRTDLTITPLGESKNFVCLRAARR